MAHKIGIAVLFSLVLVWAPSLKGQESKASKNSDSNIEAYTDLLRTNVQEDRAQIVTVMMQFTPEEASVFSPIYQAYSAKLTDLQNKRSTLVKDYAANSESMTDSKINELIESQIALSQQQNDLLKNVYEQVKVKLGVKTAARFMEVEEQLLMITDLKLASDLPATNQY